ncbi:MAG: McrC family protein [Spirulina sp.]
MQKPKIIELKEYEAKMLPSLPEELGNKLWQEYRQKIDVEFPSPKTKGQWKITAKGWVGQIPLSPEIHIFILPKVPIANLLKMLDYAYNLKSFHWLDDLVNCDSLPDIYDRLVQLLCDRILQRKRKGFYRTYLPQAQKLGYLRGKLDLRKTLQKPWQTQLHCHYETHTSDIPDNQILAWTIFLIRKHGQLSSETALKVRQTYFSLQNIATITPCKASHCRDRHYNRLNQDYQPLHVLCRFFLENISPSHLVGEYSTIPFLINMAQLYEQFVANWLKENLPPNLYLTIQDTIKLKGDIIFSPDLVLIDRITQKVNMVLDTKYKTPKIVKNSDIYQICTYATVKDCTEAVLIYPKTLERSLDTQIGQVRLRGITFSLEDDINFAGQKFLQECLSVLEEKET